MSKKILPISIVFIILFITNNIILFAADGIIDEKDIEKINNALWSRIGDDRYDAAVDLNNDGIINGLDYKLLLLSYGSTIGDTRYNLAADIYCFPPTPVMLDISDTTFSSVTLNWTVSNDTDFYAYHIYYSNTDIVDTDSNLATTIYNRNDTISVITGLIPDTNYYFKIYVSDTGGNLAGSNIVYSPTDELLVSIPEMLLVDVSSETFIMWEFFLIGDGYQVIFNNNYYVGKYSITNKEFSDMLNYAFINDWIYYSEGSIYLTETDTEVIRLSMDACRINFAGDSFSVQNGWDSFPVVYITWYGAAIYTNWLSIHEGLNKVYDTTTWLYDTTANGYHLLTEAQWEFAARGADTIHYPWGNTSIDTNYNYRESGDPFDNGFISGITPVDFYDGSLQLKTDYNWLSADTEYQTGNGSSWVGAYDMSGNVYEWCYDWYGDYTEDTEIIDPIGPSSGTERILRGGAWTSESTNSRVHSRYSALPAVGNPDMGFRIGRTDI